MASQTNNTDSVTAANAPAMVAKGVCKTFLRQTGEIVHALDGVSVEVRHAELTALVGPDGAGKTTLLRLAAGLMSADAGELTVLGLDVSSAAGAIQSRIGYMPQRFGLYEDLSVQENLDLYADMHGVTATERKQRYERLMQMTALGPFTKRLAGRLSGGMKQKLGLACTLIRQPELLLLDEPTVGVDPLSRRELWEIISELVHQQNLSVLMSTSYLDEAQRCEHAIILHLGKVLAHGKPSEVSALAAGRTFLAKPLAGQTARGLQSRLLDSEGIIDAVPEAGMVRIVRASRGSPELGPDMAESVIPTREQFKDGFMVLMRASADEARVAGVSPARNEGILPSRKGVSSANSGARHAGEIPTAQTGSAVLVEVRDLVRRFGEFVAVDHISFEVRRGEVFGLLGPNGAGKTTTFRMLCGLLAASGGTLKVAGVDLHNARASARQSLGYVAQKFSLYGQLTVHENLDFFASAYGLRRAAKQSRVEWAMRQFDLGQFARLKSEQLPGGYKQRLAMAAALLHEPDILFFDEPTSGADPLARRDFWRRITSLAQEGVTVIVTTHFMEEAEYCDRVAIMDAGKVLAQDTPAAIREQMRKAGRGESTMEDAFIAIVDEARRVEPGSRPSAGGAA